MDESDPDVTTLLFREVRPDRSEKMPTNQSLKEQNRILCEAAKILNVEPEQLPAKIKKMQFDIENNFPKLRKKKEAQRRFRDD
jgi:transcriptional regulator with GAF, ATPase, and Fis domain